MAGKKDMLILGPDLPLQSDEELYLNVWET